MQKSCPNCKEVVKQEDIIELDDKEYCNYCCPKIIKIGDLKANIINIYEDEEDIFDSILNYQADTIFSLDELIEEVENTDEHEIADGLVNPYTAELLKWYQEDLDRLYYIGEAKGELGADDIFSMLSGGQYLYYKEKINEVKEKILKYLNDLKDTEREE
jgi:hypothetical protein